MKTFIKFIAVALFLIGIFFLCVSFYNSSINPGKWIDNSRFIFAVGSGVLMIIVIMVYGIFKSVDNDNGSTPKDNLQ